MATDQLPESSSSTPATEQNVQTLGTVKMSPQVAEVLSFEGHSHLLRASRSTSVMHNFAAIYGDSSGSTETYALSEEVTSISAFISHNWVVHRAKKYLCLCLVFNFRVAAMVAVIGMLVLLVLLRMRLLPPILMHEDESESYVYARLLVCPLFLCVFFFLHELQRCFGMVGSTVFLDKTCISQVDIALQQEGIKKLGAFIRKSSRMITIYTDIYLTKLWTVYEIACFLTLSSPERLLIVPVSSPLVTLAVLVIMWLLFVYDFVFFDVLPPTIDLILIGAPMVIFAVFLRRWARTLDKARQRVAHFRVEDCTCFCETDRPLVCDNIALLMRAKGEVDRDASVPEALDAFNRLVRKDIPEALRASMGPTGLRYEHIALMFFIPLMTPMVDIGAPRYEAVLFAAELLRGCITSLAVVPLCYALLAAMCKTCIQLTGCKEWCLVGLAWFVSVVCFVFAGALLASIIEPLRDEEADVQDHDVLIQLIIILVVSVFSTYAVYSGLWVCHRQHSPEEKHDHRQHSPEEEEKREEEIEAGQ